MNRARELLLELMLLRERYSEGDVKEVGRVLAALPQSEELRRIYDLLNALGSAKEERKSKKEPIDAVAVEKMKVAFIEKLKSDARYRGYKQISGVAKRFGLSVRIGESDAAIEEISKKLMGMEPEEALRVLRRPQKARKADEGYLDLADYLIHKE